MRTLLALPLLLSLPANADWSRLFVEEATASSYLKNNWNKYSENYHPNYAFDDNPKTAWVEGADGDGHGSWLRFEVSRVPKAKALKLRLRNGYQKSKGLFSANAVPKVLEVVVRGPGGGEVVKTAELRKTLGWQDLVVELGGKGVHEIELRLKDTYPGRVYKDTCLSDVQVLVDSEVPYAAGVEKAKRDRLKKWVKGRLKEAKYFASLPPSYPFASTHFERVDGFELSQASHQWRDGKSLENAGFVPLEEILADLSRLPDAAAREKLRAVAGSVAEVRRLADGASLSKARYRVEGPKEPAVLPDGVPRHEFPELLLPLLERSAFSVAETPKALRSHLKAKGEEEPIEGYILERKRSTAQIERAGGKLKRIYFWEELRGVERGTFTNRDHYLVELDDQERFTRATHLSRGDEGWSVAVYALRRDDAGKIAEIEVTRANTWREPGMEEVVATNNFGGFRLISGTKVSQR